MISKVNIFTLIFLSLCILTTQAQLNMEAALSKYGIKDLAVRMGGGILNLKEKSFEDSFGILKLREGTLHHIKTREIPEYIKKTIQNVDSIELAAFEMPSSKMITLYFIYVYENGPVGVNINIFTGPDQTTLYDFELIKDWEAIAKRTRALETYEGTFKITPSN